jgi:hypothetical protein
MIRTRAYQVTVEGLQRRYSTRMDRERPRWAQWAVSLLRIPGATEAEDVAPIAGAGPVAVGTA